METGGVAILRSRLLSELNKARAVRPHSEAQNTDVPTLFTTVSYY